MGLFFVFWKFEHAAFNLGNLFQLTICLAEMVSGGVTGYIIMAIEDSSTFVLNS